MLSSRLASLTKKLTLETKLRDAALSLSKVNASYKGASKQPSEQLENANRKVDAAQKELWRVSEKAGEVNRRLLEHRAGVLSYSVRSMEKRMAPPDAPNGDLNGSGSSTPNRNSAMSPTQSSTFSAQSSSSRMKFDGAHFFAGHSDAIVPTSLRPGASSKELIALQEQLKAAQDALDAAHAQQGRMSKELSSLQSEKKALESSKSSELRKSEEMIAALQRQMNDMQQGLGDRASQLEGERAAWEIDRTTWENDRAMWENDRAAWENDRDELEQRRREVGKLERRLVVLEEQSAGLAEVEATLAREQRKLDEKDREIAELKAERAALLADRAALQAGGESKVQLEEGVDALQELMRAHSVSHYSRDASVRGLAESIGKHLEEVRGKVDSHVRAQEEWVASRAKLESDVRAGLDKREVLDEQLEAARKERDAALAEARDLANRIKVRRSPGHTHAGCLIHAHFRRFTRATGPLSSILAMPVRSSRSSSQYGLFCLLPMPARRRWAGRPPLGPPLSAAPVERVLPPCPRWMSARSRHSTIPMGILSPRDQPAPRSSPWKHLQPVCRPS